MKKIPLAEIADNLDAIIGEPGWTLQSTRIGPITNGNRQSVEIHASKDPVTNTARLLTAVDGMVAIVDEVPEPKKAATPMKPAKVREKARKA